MIINKNQKEKKGMNNQERNENNQITVTGTLVSLPTFSHSYGNEKFYQADLMVKRESESVDILNILLSDYLVPMDELFIGETLSIEGSIRTYNLHEKDKNRLKLHIFVDELAYKPDTEDDINDVELIGYICKKNPIRETPKGRIICDISLAVNRSYGKSDYIPCIFWGKEAKYVDKLPVGTCIKTSGRLQSRDYLKNDEIYRAYEMSNKKVLVINEQQKITK